MGLEFPQTYQKNNFQACHKNTSQTNLQRLLGARAANDVTTQIAQEAFQDYKNAQLGFFHQFKKYTASVLAYGATLGVPVAAAVGTSYWLLKNMTSSEPFFGTGNPLFDAIAPYTNPKFILGSIAAITAVDFVAEKTLNFAPARAVGKWTIQMMSTAILYAAYKAGELTTSSYEQEEREKELTRKHAHQTIIKKLTETYDNIADGFTAHCYEVINSPSDLIELKKTAVALEERFSFFRKSLAQLELKPFEVSQILDRLFGAIHHVKDMALEFRVSQSKEDVVYNTELLKVLTLQEVASKAIPKTTQLNLEIAKVNTLGIGHTLKSYVCSGISGLATTAFVATVIPATLSLGTYFISKETFGHIATCSTSPNISCGIEGSVLGLSTLLGGVQGTSSAQRILNNFRKERILADAKKVNYQDLAYTQLLTIYTDIADNLKAQWDSVKHNASKKTILAAEFRGLQEKLPMVKAAINKSGFEVDPIMNELEKVLQMPTTRTTR